MEEITETFPLIIRKGFNCSNLWVSYHAINLMQDIASFCSKLLTFQKFWDYVHVSAISLSHSK